MRVLDGDIIISRVEELFLRLNYNPPSLSDVKFSQDDMDKHELELATVLDENIELAKTEKRPLCQDCGVAQVFIKKGKHLTFSCASNINDLINEGVRRAYDHGLLRKSTVEGPFERHNNGNNLPVYIDLEETDGAGLSISGMVKGGGSENVSDLRMMSPAEGREGVANFVISTLKNAAGKGCPPYFVGVGVGGTFDTVASISKKALMERSQDDEKLLDEINSKLGELDYGVLGFPGKSAVKDIFIKTAPTHIAMMPVAVALNCHSFRCGDIEL